MRNNKNKNK